MSPRQDTYLTLCLELASKSPLHYRHGCIIVRGGKVVGSGFYHYRPGFDGGHPKNGRTKGNRHIGQQDIKPKRKSGARNEASCACGGGLDANMALSMHSKMMAIRSTLSLSSHQSGASARATAWYATARFKLPGGGKREHKLRKENIWKYVEMVYETADKCGGKIEPDDFATQSDIWRFESDPRRLDQAQQQYPQRVFTEPEEGFEGKEV
jgi:hypothetical protein